MELFFENIISGIQHFLVRPYVPVDIIRLSFNFVISSRKSQSQQKLAKTIIHVIIQSRSKHLAHFTNLNSLDIENNMLPQDSKKNFINFLYKFTMTSQIFQQVIRNICTAPFLESQELHFGSTLKVNVCIFHVFLYISIKMFVLEMK